MERELSKKENKKWS